MANWLRQYIGETEDSTRKEARWVAVGMVSTKDALTDPDFPIHFNDPHPDYPEGWHRCDNVRIDAAGFKVMSVTATFTIPVSGPGGAHDPDEPSLTTPLVYSWSTVQESVPIDTDVDGNAILTSARRAPQGATRPLNYKRVTITRWEASYNLPSALTYENSTNSGTFEGAAADTVKCSIIQPSQSYTVESALIPIDYVFDFRSEDVWGEKPWQLQFIDADSYGMVSVSGNTERRRLVTKAGESLTDIPLDGSGRPLSMADAYNPADDVSYYLNATDPAPQASPSWASIATPTGATVVNQGLVRALRYKHLPSRDFSALGF